MRRMSLRNKLMLSMLLCFIIPLVANYFVTNYATKDMILQRAVTSADDSLKAMQIRISGEVNQMLQLSNMLLMNTEVRKHLTSPLYQTSAEKNDDFLLSSVQMIRHLDDLFAQNSNLYITVIGKNGFIYTNYPYSTYDPHLLQEQSWFLELDALPAFSAKYIGLQPNVMGAYETRLKSPSMLTIGRSIKTEVGEAIGTILFSINESTIRSELNAFQGQEMMLLDENQTILSHPNADQVGQSFPYKKYAKMQHTLEYGGNSYIYVEQPLANTEWKLLSLIPQTSAVEKNKQILFMSFVLQILFFTLFCILLAVLITAITSPIVKLNKFITRVDRGQLDIRSGIRGYGEVGRLGRAIDEMLDRIESMVDQITVEQVKQRKAELEMLQAQINPHFMFNLLNSIRLSILIRGDKENADLISSLSSLLRMTINRDNEFIPLQEEVETSQHYMRLMNFRHANQVQMNVNLIGESAKCLVPRFMIQPFIENAIIHGFHQYDGQIDIESQILFETGRSFVKIKIRDRGVGMSEEVLHQLKKKFALEGSLNTPHKTGFSGIGIINVFKRLKLIHGEQFTMDIQSELDIGTTILLQLPLKSDEVGGVPC
ncbi:histidine kinase [Paenibacillus sp. N1-5-1-14]|uniref:sensor histidine kinase n=1 Tax=Paenibacillus radicibacter TaxID=2972488 RepID=UPI002158F00E|nr:sensor histidine kinase [Paenibacillus radicibacter]MCR8642579.1 histidine kinase [Paenibacillus radicibacter]